MNSLPTVNGIFDNIRQTVTDTFRASGYELDNTDAVLEPSYICEALGLQQPRRKYEAL